MAESTLIGGTVQVVLYGAQGQRARKIMAKMTPEGVIEMWAHQIYWDSNNVEIHGRTDDYGLVRNRPYESRRVVASNPFVVNNGSGIVTIYTCPANTIAEAGIWLGSEGTTAGKIDLVVGGRKLMDDVLAPNNVPPLHIQGIRLTAAQTVTAASSQATINVWVDVDEFSTGDEATGV